MPLRRIMKGEPSAILAAEGILYHNWDALTSCQRECTTRVGKTIQLEQEAYLTAHPEVGAMLAIFISKMSSITKRRDILKQAAMHFTRPAETLDEEVRIMLNLPPGVPYIKSDKQPFKFHDYSLEEDLKEIIRKYYPPEPWKIVTPLIPTPDTVSSSFISVISSGTTLPTPEPIPTFEPTLSENMFALISNTVDKAFFSHVDDQALRYDTAYVELSKTVEQAMEIPVVEIREDIAELLFNAYQLFELDIMEKERIAAELAWEKRMRKKLKRTLRRLNNFKGYETPPTPRSQISSHESYKKPPPRPCKCHPPFHYNRYPKDRFGIYMPRDVEFSSKNITATPVISLENLTEDQNDDKTDTKSIISKKSAVSTKSAKSTISKKTTFET